MALGFGEAVLVGIHAHRDVMQFGGRPRSTDLEQTLVIELTQRDDESRVEHFLAEQCFVHALVEALGVRRETEADSSQPGGLARDVCRLGGAVSVQMIDAPCPYLSRNPLRGARRADRIGCREGDDGARIRRRQVIQR